MMRRLIWGTLDHITRPSRRRYEQLEERNLRLQAQVARETKRRVQTFDKLQDLRFAAKRAVINATRAGDGTVVEVEYDLIATLVALLPTDRMD
ncbi:MAG: hypothetical protein GY913_21625 [Proteobacteria bacterium]|nr:hypothetical protein [Actinomycetes bacterium]MCP4919510.1 hypothetical protein [Pseudomonadota bacterium]